MSRLLIGTPSFSRPAPEFSVDSLAPLMYHIGRRYVDEISKVGLHRDYRTYRHTAREAIFERARQEGWDYLLFLDDDHVFTKENFDRLWKNRDLGIISALYFTRSIPPAPCIFKMTANGSEPYLDYPRDSIMTVDIVGFGFVLIDINKTRDLNQPLFTLPFQGEDVAFGTRCQLAGVKIHVDTGNVVDHLIETPMRVNEEAYDFYVKNQMLGPHAEAGLVRTPALEDLYARNLEATNKARSKQV